MAGPLAKKKIVLVTGKGGVGKSLISFGIALAEAKKGRRVLLVEPGESGYFSHFLSRPVGFEAVAADEKWPNLFVARWGGNDCLKDYVEHMLKVRSLVTAFFAHPVMQAFIAAAPALSDVSILGKLTSGLRNVGPALDFDLIVFDAYSTGHFLAMMRAPLGLAEAIQMGPMGKQSRQIHDVLTDLSVCAYGVVTLPEELPVQESEELLARLRGEWGIEPFVVCNALLPETPLSEADEQTEFGAYLSARYRNQRRYLRQIEEATPNTFQLEQIFENDRSLLVEEAAARLERAWS